MRWCIAVLATLGLGLAGCADPTAVPAQAEESVGPIKRLVLDSASDEHLRLAVIGDKGELNEALARGLSRLHDDNPIDAILLLGDNFYECGVRGAAGGMWYRFEEDLGTLPIPTYAVLGNHDYGVSTWTPTMNMRCPRTVVDAQIEATGGVPGWHMPARNYVLQHPLAEIVVVDTSPVAYGWDDGYRGSATSAETLAWLDRALAESTAPMTLVAGHHPFRGSGPHVQSNDRHDQAVVANLAGLEDLLDARGPDLYASGHDHHLELMFEPGRRPALLVSGAGSRLRPLVGRPAGDDGPSTVFPEPGSRTFLGFALVEVTVTSLEVSFFDQHGRPASESWALR